MLFTKNKNFIKKKRKNKTIKKTKKKFKGGTDPSEQYEIEYVKNNFIYQKTESNDNKCLYFAYYRSLIGDLKTPDEEIRANIREINQKVYDYMRDENNKHRFESKDIKIANPDSKEYQTDNHVMALANVLNTVILVHEQNNELQRMYPHFTKFEPLNYDGKNKNPIFFMSNTGNYHYTSLIPKTEEIYKSIVEIVKGREVPIDEIQKSGVVFANRVNEDITLLPSEKKSLLATTSKNIEKQTREPLGAILEKKPLIESKSEKVVTEEEETSKNIEKQTRGPLGATLEEKPLIESKSEKKSLLAARPKSIEKQRERQLGATLEKELRESEEAKEAKEIVSKNVSLAENLNYINNVSYFEPLPVFVGIIGLAVLLTMG